METRETRIEKKSLMPFRSYNDLEGILPFVWRDFYLARTNLNAAEVDALRERCRQYIKSAYRVRISVQYEDLKEKSDMVQLLNELLFAGIFQGRYFEVTEREILYPKMVLVTEAHAKRELASYVFKQRRKEGVELLARNSLPDGISYEVFVVSDSLKFRTIAGHVRKKSGELIVTLMRINRGTFTFRFAMAEGRIIVPDDGDEWVRMALMMAVAATVAANQERSAIVSLHSPKPKQHMTLRATNTIRLDGDVTVVNYMTTDHFKRMTSATTNEK